MAERWQVGRRRRQCNKCARLPAFECLPVWRSLHCCAKITTNTRASLSHLSAQCAHVGRHSVAFVVWSVRKANRKSATEPKFRQLSNNSNGRRELGRLETCSSCCCLWTRLQLAKGRRKTTNNTCEKFHGRSRRSIERKIGRPSFLVFNATFPTVGKLGAS